MRKLSLQNFKDFLKIKKNLLIIFLFLIIFILIYCLYILIKKERVLEDENKLLFEFCNEIETLFDVLDNNSLEDNSQDKKINERKEGTLKTYELNDFSDEYRISVELFGYDEQGDYIGTSRIIYSLFDKKTDKLLMTIDTAKSKNANDYPAEFMNFKTTDGLIKINENPYIDQISSPVFYEDFNFDGVKDFAFLTGNQGGYRSSSFDIYLSTKNSFVYNEDFTKLTQDYQGMFDIKDFRLITGSREGASIYYRNEFIVENNKPKKILKITRYQKPSDKGYYIEITIEKLVNGVWTKEVTTEPYEK